MPVADAYERFGARSFFQMVGGRVWVAMSRAEQGDFIEANQRIEEAIAIADRAQAPHERVWSRFGAGRVAFVRGELERAAGLLEAILPLARSDLSIYISRIASTLGSTYLLAGRTADAVPLLEQAAHHGQSIGFMHGHSLVLAMLAEGYLHAGRLDHAQRTAQEGLALACKLGERGWEAWVLRALGEIAAVGVPAEAAEHYRRALVLATELGMRPLQAHCHQGLARVSHADAERLNAIDLYRKMGMTFWLHRTSTQAAP
jgi:tetratricopeptide (TPR) repeat protein